MCAKIKFGIRSLYMMNDIGDNLRRKISYHEEGARRRGAGLRSLRVQYVSWHWQADLYEITLLKRLDDRTVSELGLNGVATEDFGKP